MNQNQDEKMPFWAWTVLLGTGIILIIVGIWLLPGGKPTKEMVSLEGVVTQIYPNYDFPDGVNQIKVPLIPPEQRLSRQAGGWVKAPPGARVRFDHDVPVTLENIDGRRIYVRPDEVAWFGVEPGNGLVRFYGERDKLVTISIKRDFYK